MLYSYTCSESTRLNVSCTISPYENDNLQLTNMPKSVIPQIPSPRQFRYL
jgi:hypothetical protein